MRPTIPENFISSIFVLLTFYHVIENCVLVFWSHVAESFAQERGDLMRLGLAIQTNRPELQNSPLKIVLKNFGKSYYGSISW
jgi:hypothetical protein